MSDATTFFDWGKVGRPHGVRGEMRVFPANADDVTELPRGTLVQLATEEDRLVAEVVTCRGAGRFRILRLDEVRGREAAERWKHARIGVHEQFFDGLEEPDEHEYFATMLQGFAVHTATGDVLGEVKALVDYGGGDILVVKTTSGEEMIPFAEPWIELVDEDAQIVIAAAEHWLDDALSERDS